MSSSTTNPMNVAADDGSGPVPYPKRWAAAFVMILAALLDMIDGSIVNTALPSIGKGLKATPADLQWTVSAYMLGFAATLIIAGHLGDRYGRKKLFLLGVTAFALTSLASALAASAGVLVASRGLQGVAAAVIMPQILASFRTMFDGEERGKAFALYGAIAGISTAVGVLLGGILTDWDLFGWGWRTIFVINLPLAAVVLVLGARWIPASRDRAFTGRIDLPGNLVLAAGLVAIVLPLVQGRSYGWPVWEKKALPMTATPRAPPNCWAVERIPDAPPASWPGTVLRIVLTSGMIRRIRPTPASTRPGTNGQAPVCSWAACWAACRTQNRPPAMTRAPRISTPRPKLATSGSTAGAARMDPALKATINRPACVGV